MTKEKIISESQNLYSDIDYCITELLRARTEHNSENEGRALFKMESLMVSTLQHLACIIEQPSLPSNLDEAAEEYSERFQDKKYKLYAFHGFRDGAMWRDSQAQKLSNDIDGAAELSANDAMIKRQFPSVVYNRGLKCFDHSDLIKQFKAGAEWMAGQGRTVDGTFHRSRGYPSVIELKTYLRDYEGADVIVQIRKKQ